MIPRACKRIAEVDFPIAAVSKHSAREKSIRHGHPSTLHLWWARRPLAACRAMLLGLLLPDPCDEHCPEDFKGAARTLLPRVQGRVAPGGPGLRKALLKFIGDFANWDLSSDPTYLEVSRGLVKAAHGDGPPLVVDPFAGGGSIPLEALRLGCDAFASDLNPIACLILKTMLEDIPRHGPQLAEEVRRAGAEIKKAAEEEIGVLYPSDPDHSRPIAYIWARTVRCESPGCGAEIPLARSFWLCTKANRLSALRPIVTRSPRGAPRIDFEIFTPGSIDAAPEGTVSRAKATCLACRVVLPPERVRAQLAAEHGGADVVFDPKGLRTGGARLLAVVTLRPGEQGRRYRLPTERDYDAVRNAQERLAAILGGWERGGKKGLCPVPDEPLPPIGTLGFRVQRYGMLRWGDLFTARQKVALRGLVEQTAARKATGTDASVLAIGKLVDLGNALCAWMPGQECPSAVFKLGRVKTGWDFVEGCPFGGSSGSFEKCTDNLAAGVVATDTAGSKPGQAAQAMAQRSPVPDESASVWFTDPPYYDAIPYADLADFFLVWMKRILPDHPLLRDPFDPTNQLSPKDQEAVQDDARLVNGQPKDAAFFDAVMGEAFAEGERTLREDGIGAVVFAHKTTEGWEALLSGMIRGGWTITGSWPIATEMGHRLRARESAALATSIHLICRPRPQDSPVGDWGDVLRELPPRIAEWMKRLSGEGIRGADLVFACIGPAMEVYSRYSRVEDAEGREIPLGGDPTSSEPHKRGFLAYVWETVGRVALQQVLGTGEARARNGAAGAIEEDARLTALFLWTLQATEAGNDADGDGTDPEGEEDDSEEDDGKPVSRKTTGFTLIYDVVRRFAQPLGIHLEVWEGRIIETDKGIVRLLSVAERARQLFGQETAASLAARFEKSAPDSIQKMLFSMKADSQVPEVKGRARGRKVKGSGKRPVTGGPGRDPAVNAEPTTLDRVHAAMLLQSGGQSNALRAMLKSEQERGPDFLRLANALSALYPVGSEEKRLLDAMLLVVPRG